MITPKVRETLAAYIERNVTNGLMYNPIRDPTVPMRDPRTLSPYMSKQEREERLTIPIEQTMRGVQEHLRDMEVRNGAFKDTIRAYQADVRKRRGSFDPNTVKLRSLEPRRLIPIRELD